MSKISNPLVLTLFQALKDKKMSVPRFSEQTGIPPARVYKWKIEGGPKAEDAEKINKWLNGETSNNDNVNRGTVDNQSIKDKTSPGFVPADQVIADLRRDKEWLQAILETSLVSIVEGQKQSSIQLKGLTWYQIHKLNNGDQQAIDRDMIAINNRIASFEGIVGEGDNSKKADSKHTGGSRQQKQ